MEATYNASDNKRLKFETSSLQDGDEFVCLCTFSMGVLETAQGCLFHCHDVVQIDVWVVGCI